METKFGTNDPRTQKVWSKKAFQFAMAKNFFYQHGMIGPKVDVNSIIVVDKSLQEQGAGDEIIFDLEVPLNGEGIGDHGNLLDNSEQMTTQNFRVRVHERGHSVQSGGPLSEIRTATKFRESAYRRIGLWQSDTVERDIARAIFGIYNAAGIATVNQKIPLVGTGIIDGTRHLIGGQTMAGVTDLDQVDHTGLTSALNLSQLFGCHVISAAKQLAMTPSRTKSMIRPIKTEYGDVYVMLVHQWQAWQLRQDTTWINAQLHANIKGIKNPLFSGILGIWDNVLVIEYPNAPSRLGANGITLTEGWIRGAGTTPSATATTCTTASILPNTVRAARAVLLGAQAGVLGWGKPFGWRESEEDAGRKPVIGSDAIYAVSKTRFANYTTAAEDDPDTAGTNTDQSDFAVVTVDTQINQPYA